MSDNLPPPRTGGIALPGYRVLALEGRDATAFAQAQCMNEVAALPVGHWQWNGWLTPKGRVVALFALLKLDPERLWLLLPDADPTALAAQLQRFVFRSKVTLAPRTDLVPVAAFSAPMRAAGATFAGDATQGIELDFGGAGGPRSLRLGTAAGVVDDAGGVARWMMSDLEHGLARLDTDQSGQWTPQMLSLQRLRAFSVKKGCYPGQEIVARTHFLGHSKRGLVLLEAAATLAAGGDVGDGERVLGSVVSAVTAGDRHLALAVLPLAREADILHVDGVPVRETPLLDGLAR
jgi:folate-binding protein YgfZ